MYHTTVYQYIHRYYLWYIAYTGIEFTRLFSGLAKLFPITPTVKESDKSRKEADERYGEYEGRVIQWIEDWVGGQGVVVL